MIWEEYFPNAFSIGIHMEEFKHLTPKKLEYCLKGFCIEQKRKDEEMWRMGLYVQSAVSTAVERNLAGKKAKSEYIKEPLLSKSFENEGLTEKEVQEKEIKKAILTEQRYMAMAINKGLPETIIL